MRRIFHPSLVASDAGRARKDVIVNVHVSDVKTLDSALINVLVKMKGMVGRDDMDVTWVFLSRKTSFWPRQALFQAYLLVGKVAQIRATRERDRSDDFRLVLYDTL